MLFDVFLQIVHKFKLLRKPCDYLEVCKIYITFASGIWKLPVCRYFVHEMRYFIQKD